MSAKNDLTSPPVVTLQGREMLIPTDAIEIGVMGDKNAQQIIFDVQRIYDGVFDLSSAEIYVELENEMGEYDTIMPELTIGDERFTAAWTVQQSAVLRPGKVKVRLCARSADTFKWQSHTGIFNVYETFGADQEVPEYQITAVEQILAQLQAQMNVSTALLEDMTSSLAEVKEATIAANNAADSVSGLAADAQKAATQAQAAANDSINNATSAGNSASAAEQAANDASGSAQAAVQAASAIGTSVEDAQAAAGEAKTAAQDAKDALSEMTDDADRAEAAADRAEAAAETFDDAPEDGEIYARQDGAWVNPLEKVERERWTKFIASTQAGVDNQNTVHKTYGPMWALAAYMNKIKGRYLESITWQPSNYNYEVGRALTIQYKNATDLKTGANTGLNLREPDGYIIKIASATEDRATWDLTDIENPAYDINPDFIKDGKIYIPETISIGFGEYNATPYQTFAMTTIFNDGRQHLACPYGSDTASLFIPTYYYNNFELIVSEMEITEQFPDTTIGNLANDAQALIDSENTRPFKPGLFVKDVEQNWTQVPEDNLSAYIKARRGGKWVGITAGDVSVSDGYTGNLYSEEGATRAVLGCYFPQNGARMNYYFPEEDYYHLYDGSAYCKSDYHPTFYLHRFENDGFENITLRKRHFEFRIKQEAVDENLDVGVALDIRAPRNQDEMYAPALSLPGRSVNKPNAPTTPIKILGVSDGRYGHKWLSALKDKLEADGIQVQFVGSETTEDNLHLCEREGMGWETLMGRDDGSNDPRVTRFWFDDSNFLFTTADIGSVWNYANGEVFTITAVDSTNKIITGILECDLNSWTSTLYPVSGTTISGGLTFENAEVLQSPFALPENNNPVATYCARWGIDEPDYVIFCMGYNDIIKKNEFFYLMDNPFWREQTAKTDGTFIQFLVCDLPMPSSTGAYKENWAPNDWGETIIENDSLGAKRAVLETNQFATHWDFGTGSKSFVVPLSTTIDRFTHYETEEVVLPYSSQPITEDKGIMYLNEDGQTALAKQIYNCLYWHFGDLPIL